MTLVKSSGLRLRYRVSQALQIAGGVAMMVGFVMLNRDHELPSLFRYRPVCFSSPQDSSMESSHFAAPIAASSSRGMRILSCRRARALAGSTKLTSVRDVAQVR